MSENQKLQEAVEKSKQLPTRPSNEELLQLYALYKQATEGNASGERPGGFDFKAIAKFDAWKALQGMPEEQAVKCYVDFVDVLQNKYGG